MHDEDLVRAMGLEEAGFVPEKRDDRVVYHRETHGMSSNKVSVVLLLFFILASWLLSAVVGAYGEETDMHVQPISQVAGEEIT